MLSCTLLLDRNVEKPHNLSKNHLDTGKGKVLQGRKALTDFNVSFEFCPRGKSDAEKLKVFSARMTLIPLGDIRRGRI